LEQEITVDAGDIVESQNIFALHSTYPDLVAGGGEFSANTTGVMLQKKDKPDNVQLGFEVRDLDYWVTKIKATDGIEILHDVIEYSWGQRAFRFYDDDGHILEIDEDLEVVAKRLLMQGLSVEEVSEQFGYPRLGQEYLLGRGVPRDIYQAIEWFRKAAEQGNYSAQIELGLVYFSGNGVLEDIHQAIEWFRKAAEQENSTAQFQLGRMYVNLAEMYIYEDYDQ